VSEIRLDGKVAIVTGSGRGLGRAYAKGLAAAGARVVVNDLDADSAAATVAQIAAAGGEAVSEVAAVGTSEAAERLVARAVSEFGRLDAMVTNAGVLRDRVLWKMGDEDFDLVIATHLRGTFTCARAAAIQMREQGEGGRIIVVGSPAGQYGNFGQTNYSAAKAGIVAFARTWALELARSSVTVNAIVPTAWTEMTATIPIYEPLVSRSRPGSDAITRSGCRRSARRSWCSWPPTPPPGSQVRRSESGATGCRCTRIRPSSCTPFTRVAGAPSRSRSSGRPSSQVRFRATV
jgi:NAD(P)-dependent dehydrogenase (short-subunit alcohol dehydrogenase family)